MSEKKENIPLGQLLIKNEKITEEQLSKALEEQKNTKNKLGHTLINLQYLTENDLIEVLEKQFGIPAVKVNLKMLNPQVSKTIPENICRKYRLIPILLHKNKLTVAASDPYNMAFTNEIKFTTNYDLNIILWPEKSILSAINKIYGERESNWDPNIDELEEDEKKAHISAVKMLNQILIEGFNKSANEIQLEYYNKKFNVIYITKDYGIINKEIPNYYYKAISIHIKNAANLDVKTQSFQEGIFKANLINKNPFIRALIFPTPAGENISLKIP